MKSLAISRKLQNARGETLVEALCSILIVVAVMSILSTAIVTSAKMDEKAKASDAAYVEQHNAAEMEKWIDEGTASPKVTITFTDSSFSYQVQRTDTTDDGLSAFRLRP